MLGKSKLTSHDPQPVVHHIHSPCVWCFVFVARICCCRCWPFVTVNWSHTCSKGVSVEGTWEVKTDLVESGETLIQNDIRNHHNTVTRCFFSRFVFVSFVVLEAYQPFRRWFNLICKFDWEHQYRSTHTQGFLLHLYIETLNSHHASSEYVFLAEVLVSLEFEVKEVDPKMITVKPEIMMMFEARISFLSRVEFALTCDSSHSFQDLYFEEFFLNCSIYFPTAIVFRIIDWGKPFGRVGLAGRLLVNPSKALLKWKIIQTFPIGHPKNHGISNPSPRISVT